MKSSFVPVCASLRCRTPSCNAKCLTIDGRYNIIGSYNVDAYGGKHNLEVGVASADPALSKRLEDEFRRRSADAVEIDLDSWLHRPRRSRLMERLLYRLFRL